MIAAARRMARAAAWWLARRGMKAYVAGEQLSDALALGVRLRARDLGVSIGYWDGPGDAPRAIADEYLAGIDALAGQERAYLSIKPPSLGYSGELMAEVVERAARARVRLHFDALAPETADRARELFEKCLERGAELSYTLPGRWARSVDDAAWAAERGIAVRVVKGQWPDPRQPDLDPERGYLQVIDALAGRAHHVAVASHDEALVGEALRRLEAARTSHQIELLHGLPARPLLRLARARSLPVHVYVPYGTSFLPYAISGALANPRIFWWVVRDLVASWRS